MSGTVHVIGAGLSGLACAIRLRESGASVVLHEAASYAGGRTRSFYDSKLGRVIDNGTHLLLSGNNRVMAYLETIGAKDQLSGPARSRLDFLDIRTSERWSLKPSTGRFPWWAFNPWRRVPGTKSRDYMALMNLARAKPDDTFDDCIPPPKNRTETIYERLWEPLCVSVMNTPPAEADAKLMWAVIKESLLKGESYCRPRLARNGLSAAFVDPALSWLEKNEVEVRFSRRLERLEVRINRARSLKFKGDEEPIRLGADDRVVLAVPSIAARQLLPEIDVPDKFETIVNVHYRMNEGVVLGDNGGVPLGLIGGVAHWLLVKGDVVSITISAGRNLEDEDAESLAARMWPEVAKALVLQRLIREGSADALENVPPNRVIKEHRATNSQTPAEIKKRPTAKTGFANIFLAGDWTDTGLPATIEGSIRSGETAAALAVEDEKSVPGP